MLLGCTAYSESELYDVVMRFQFRVFFKYCKILADCLRVVQRPSFSRLFWVQLSLPVKLTYSLTFLFWLIQWFVICFGSCTLLQ